MILQFVRKKFIRDEGILQLVLLLSLLRGNPYQFQDRDPADSLPDILPLERRLGNSLGHIRIPSSQFIQETHPKSLDRVLLNYQHSVLNDLNALGNYPFSRPPHNDIHAYLLNAESSLASPSSTEEDGYISGPPSPSTLDEITFAPEGPGNPSETQEWNRDFDLMFEDLDVLEALWKQDVDMGVPRELFDGDLDQELEKDYAKCDLSLFTPATKDKDFGKEPDGSTDIDELSKDKTLADFGNFTVDSETGELLAAYEAEDNLISRDASPMLASYGSRNALNESAVDSNFHFEFNLEEALKLVENDDSDPRPTTPDIQGDPDTDSGCGESEGAVSENGTDSSGSLDALNDSLDDMIQASQLHSHHPRAIQGRLGGLVRSSSMEQRWHDLASLLSLPSPDSAHHAQSPPTPSMASHATSPVHSHSHHPPVHHPHALYPTHEPSASVGPATSPGGVPRGVLLHNSSIQPAMPDHPSHNITYSNSMGASSHLVASSMNLTNSTELPTSDHHHYKMETSSSIQPDMMYYQQNSTSEMNQTTDGFLSSILNDEDLQLMDIPMHDYNRGSGEYSGGGSYRYVTPDDSLRISQGAQKKHHLYGKRFFQENPHSGGQGNMVTGNSNVTGVGVANLPVAGAYHPHYPPTPQAMPMDGPAPLDPEMKYSCSNDFRPGPEVSGASGIDNVHHNHTYHMSPEGPSGIARPNLRDKKGKKSESQRHLSRDEKKAESMRLPITCEDIINLPMDEFNERISKHDLTEAQLSLIRDIRRRGKNKVAAQNCRKRKLDQIIHLAEEVKIIQYRKNELHSQLDHLRSERERVRHKFSLLYKHIFQSLRDSDGNPYSAHEFSLQQSADGSILLVPRSSPMDHIKNRHTKESAP